MVGSTSIFVSQAFSFIFTASSEAKKVKFDVFADATILGPNYDYYCLESRSLSSCEFAVWGIKEAKAICAISRECKAFVITPQKSWLGRCSDIIFVSRAVAMGK